MKDVEFEVHRDGENGTMFKAFDKACGRAISLSASNGEKIYIDVYIHSRAGARAWGGDDAVEQYNEDPDASASERFVISAEALGRIY